MALVKRHQNPLIFNDSPLTGVYTPGSDENSMKLNMIWCILCCWVAVKMFQGCCKDLSLLLMKIIKYCRLIMIQWQVHIWRRQPFLEDLMLIQRKLEVKQVEFKLGEDCWVIKLKYCWNNQSAAIDQRTAVSQGAACWLSQSTAS